MLQPPPVSDSSSVAMATPQLGSVHAVYHDPTVTAVGMSPGGSPQGHPAWVRGCVINVRQNETRPQEVLVLAIDYGFVFSAALTQLRPLPHACQGIIHQVRSRGEGEGRERGGEGRGGRNGRRGGRGGVGSY